MWTPSQHAQCVLVTSGPSTFGPLLMSVGEIGGYIWFVYASGDAESLIFFTCINKEVIERVVVAGL